MHTEGIKVSSTQASTTIISKHDAMSHHAGKGKQDVALFKEAASIFHHNDLRTFPLCQRDELTPAGGSVNVCRNQVAVCQNLVPLVNIKIAGKWMFIPLKCTVSIGIDP
jgi:hypothetical protein